MWLNRSMFQPSLLAILAIVLGLSSFILWGPRPATPPPQERAITLTVRDRVMRPHQFMVREGDQVTLRLETNVPITFRVDGYDITRELAPDQPETISFVAQRSGRFAISSAAENVRLGTLIVVPRRER